MLGILLSSGSFDDQCQNLKMFLLSPKLYRHLEQLEFKKYSDDIKTKCFYNMENIYVHSSKIKIKVSNDQKKINTIKNNCTHTIPSISANFIRFLPDWILIRKGITSYADQGRHTLSINQK